MAALLLGYDVNTAKPKELEEIKKLLISQKKYLRAYSSDDVNNMARGDAWIHHMWSGDFLYLRQGVVEDPDELRLRGAQRGHADQLRRLLHPHQRQAPRHRDGLHRLPAAARDRRRRTSPTSTTRSRCATRSPTFDDLAKDVPACNVDIGRPGEPRRLPAPRRRRGAAPGRGLDRSEGQLTWPPTRTPGPRPSPTPRRRRRSGQRTRLWGALLALPTAWIVGFFVSQHGHRRAAVLRPHPGRRPARSSAPPLANYEALLERGLPPAVPPLARLRRRHDPALRADRLPGGLRHRALRRALQERPDRRDRGAVLRQLPDPDVRLVGAALRRGHRQQRSCGGPASATACSS